MQFLHLFSFVVVASYAAALPQPAGLSEKYSNNVDTTLASGLEARSYQPELNSYKELATSTLLKRRGDSLELPGDNSEGSVGDNSEGIDWRQLVKERQKTILKDRLETIVKERQKTIVKERQKTILKDRLETILKERQKTIEDAEDGAIGLPFVIGDFGVEFEARFADAPENAKAAGAALGGNTGDTLVEYLKNGRQATETLKEWVEDIGKGLVDIIKLGLGDEEYSKIKSFLDDASEKVVADASDNVQQMTAALLNIEKKVGSAKQEVDAVQAAFERVLEAYKLYIETLESQLIRFKEGKYIQSHLSVGVECLVEFSENQKGLYYTIIDGLFGRVFASYKLYIETLQSQVTRFEAGEPIRDDIFTTMDSLAGFSKKRKLFIILLEMDSGMLHLNSDPPTTSKL
ncbi:hypothetical protein BASA50_001416 [Batrachochytrium salamandrivorans]|uniref:Uncharacterized protein n=1 Tax=Batrachochytrium salamandrivorans TaxID=1357716 RepID=A0ABQ8EY37_9FUNG|nr:hypothetical protein BASA50_001416 [Batrachochytrium salamandrivorans]